MRVDHGEMSVGILSISAVERRAYLGAKELSLTPREFEVLSALSAHPGWVFSAEQLAESDRRLDCASPSAVNVHVCHIRAKLAAAGGPDLVETVRGVGWRLRRPPAGGAGPGDAGPPFVGRASELSILAQALEPCEEGRFALVSGEPGAGKTSLIERALRITSPRFEVVRAVCDGNGSGDYWMWRQILLELERRTGVRLAEQPQGHLITRIIGATGDLPVGAGGDRVRLYEAVSSCLSDLLPLRPRPVVIFVDDLQWADDASIRLLTFLLKRLAGLQLRMLAACRNTGVVSEEVQEVVRWAAQRGPGTLVSLGGLDTEEIVELAGIVLGPLSSKTDGTDEATARRLEERTGGNPLYLTEYLKALGDAPGDEREAEFSAGASLATLAWDEVAWVPEETRDLIVLAAAAGNEFDPVAVARAAEGDADALLEPAVEAGILVPGTPGRLRFRHALIRDALLESMAATERETAHLRLAMAIECSEESDPLLRTVMLAHHYARAGATGHRRAIGYLVAAARAASRRFAFEDAIGALEQALALVGSASLDPQRAARVRAAIAERLGSAHAALTHTSAAIDSYGAAIDARPQSDRLALARLHTKIGAACANERERGECAHAFSCARACLEGIAVRDTAWWRSWIEVLLAEADAAALTDVPLSFGLEEALGDLVLEHGDARQRSRYYALRASELAKHGRWRDVGQASCLARRALDEAREYGSDYLVAYMTGFLGGLLVFGRELTEAEALLRTGVGLARRCADSLGETAMFMFLSMGARLAGDVRMTESYATELARLATEWAPMPEFTSSAQANLAWVALRRGRLEEAGQRSARALEIWQSEPACSQSVWQMAWPALSCALAEGDVSRAVECAVLMTRGDQQALEEDLDRAVSDAISLVHRGESEAAMQLFSRLELRAREYGYA